MRRLPPERFGDCLSTLPSRFLTKTHSFPSPSEGFSLLLASPFGRAIVCVGLVIAKKKVIDIHARGIVAFMEHVTAAGVSMRQHPRVAMSVDSAASTRYETAVPALVLARQPYSAATGIGASDLAPESGLWVCSLHSRNIALDRGSRQVLYIRRHDEPEHGDRNADSAGKAGAHRAITPRSGVWEWGR